MSLAELDKWLADDESFLWPLASDADVEDYCDAHDDAEDAAAAQLAADIETVEHYARLSS